MVISLNIDILSFFLLPSRPNLLFVFSALSALRGWALGLCYLGLLTVWLQIAEFSQGETLVGESQGKWGGWDICFQPLPCLAAFLLVFATLLPLGNPLRYGSTSPQLQENYYLLLPCQLTSGNSFPLLPISGCLNIHCPSPYSAKISRAF